MEKRTEYVVFDNYGEIKEFDSLEEANDYMEKYINEDLPSLIAEGEISGVTEVGITKKVYEVKSRETFQRRDGTRVTITNSKQIKEVELCRRFLNVNKED